ncbi:MAG: tRNA pseudouridine(38-40) synthase TruA [Polyangiales bacterium]
MPGVRLTLAYDGTQFAGFQRQLEVRTVQGVLEQAISHITQQPAIARGAGRTDAGVHAEGQVVAFDTDRELTPRRWLLALNRYLPDDVAVQAVDACEPGYDPRFDALDKLYRYLFYLGLARAPLIRHRAWQLARSGEHDDLAPLGRTATRLDVSAMRAAGAALIGTHDFRAFRAADDLRENTQRTLHRVELIEDFRAQPNVIALEVKGSAFMKNMVRIIAGTLVAVGRGRLTPNDVAGLLSADAVRHRHSETAPAQGLTLVHVTLGRKSLAQASR